MSSDSNENTWAICAQGLGKTYRLYDKPHHRLLQSLWGARRRYYRDFAALGDISFTLERGQTLGIIGRNGAGKSTLLQIICGTLTPTVGNVQVRGRIAALLELGTGFNPDFTGRENLAINAAILGLTPEEIAARADDIIAFADIGPFIDQPVKTYSSGMYVRLAFAVVVHVDPDILIVDEALSVGDAFFQAKCMTRMRNMLDKGLTLLFISHDISAVKALCNRTLWIDQGRVRALGDTAEITRAYDQDWIRQANAAQGAIKNTVTVDEVAPESVNEEPHVGTGAVRLLAVGWSVEGPMATQARANYGDTIALRMRLQVRNDCRNLVVSYHIKNRQNQHVLGGHSADRADIYLRNWNSGDTLDLVFFIPLHLHHGDYALTLVAASIADTQRYTDAVFHCWADDVATLHIAPRDLFPLSDLIEAPVQLTVQVVKPWVVLDDFFPNLLTGFRVAEYNAHLRAFPELMVLSTLGDFAEQHARYAQRYPDLAQRVQPYSPAWLAGCSFAYINFLNNAVHYLPALQGQGTPFVLNLYPGGGFGLNDAESDTKLRQVLTSPLLQAVIVTQAVTEQYVQSFAQRHSISLPGLHRIDGVVVNPLYFESDALPRQPRWGAGKGHMDVCFVAERYMANAANKGYPAFIAAAMRLANFSEFRFHVVGGGYTPDETDIALVEGRIRFYGRLETAELRAFYSGMDIIVSASQPDLLHPGNFDGFPTGCCVEAALSAVAIMATDAMQQNPGYVDAESIFLLSNATQGTSADDLPQQIADQLRQLLDKPALLASVAEAGQAFTRQRYAPQVQIGQRQKLLSQIAQRLAVLPAK